MKDQNLIRIKRFVQKLRAKNKVKYYFNYKENSIKHNGMLVHTPAICSCYLCGNPRKWFKEKTIKEKSFLEINKKLKE